MRINIFKKTVSLVLALAMILSITPPIALASDTTNADNNPWNGRSAVFVGDSITAGSGTDKIYYEYLKETLDFGAVTAMGVGGSCISAASDYGQANAPLINRYQDIPSADLIVVFMGTNDYGHATPIGTPEDMQAGTFYGALNTIIPDLLETHENSQLVFVTPLHRAAKSTGTTSADENQPNVSGHTLGDYVEAIKLTCAKYGVSVIDLHTESESDPRLDPKDVNYFPDGLHPNADGHAAIAAIMEAHIRSYIPAEKAPETEEEADLVYGNKFAPGYLTDARISTAKNLYLRAGMVLTLNDPVTYAWACAKTSGETSNNNLGYFPDANGWTSNKTAVVEEDGWVGITIKHAKNNTQVFVADELSKALSDYVTIHTHEYEAAVTAPTCTEAGYTTYTCAACGDSYTDDTVAATGHSYINGTCTGCGEKLVFEGKTVSILGHSMSTYAGVSNNTASNSTIGNNDVYYTEGRLGVYLKDTWWQQAIDALGMELLVNNSWSGSCVFQPRKGAASVGYGDRAVNLHNDHTGEEPDIIWVYIGCNDFAYFKDTFGTGDAVDYSALIQENGDGTFTYTAPQTACEAYAIMLHKVHNRYPEAEIYCITSTARRDPDYPDDRPDTGQPTAYMAELHKVAAYLGCPIVDLEDCIPKEAEQFDRYIGDYRAHANALGMDKITNEVLSVMLGKRAEICHVTAENDAVKEQAVLLGGSYIAEVDLQNGYSVSVTMDGKDVTAEVYQDGKISIQEVTGDIDVRVTSNRNPLNFSWELKDGELVSTGESRNPVNKLTGTVTDGLLNDGRYVFEIPVLLKHDLPWELEWQCAGNWRGMMLSSDPVQKTTGMTYICRTKGGQLCFGTWTGTQHDNYGVDLSNLDDQTHTYRLVNRIAADGSNMVWLYVDGTELGPMNHYFNGSTDQGVTANWLNGKDFVLPYIGVEGHPLTACQLNYLKIRECAHTYENGSCTGCGKEVAYSTLTLRYDDHYDVSGKTVEIIDAGKPTSYQVGYGVEQNTVFDTAVVTLSGQQLIATGIGSAKVSINSQLYEVTVEAAPISLLLLAGQSNMQGSEGDANQSIVCPDGIVYSTYGDRYTMTLSNATNFAPSALTGAGSRVNVNGTTANLSEWPVYLLNEAGAGKIGPDSGFGYEWSKQTGEKVWVVNAAHGGTSINVWQPGKTEYEECLALVTAVTETLRKEIAAGHFTLSHMGYFWCQGCADYSNTAKAYETKYLTMHNAFKSELAFDHDSDPTTPDKTFEFGGIIPVRTGHDSYKTYREGTSTDTTSYAYHESFRDLRMSGPRVAQYMMGNDPALPDIWTVCNIGEDWVWMPDGTNGVAEYFNKHYPNGTVDYITQVPQSDSWYKPTTPKAVHDSIHYNQIGYNEVGREAARNALILLGELPDYTEETTVKFVDWTGYKEVGQIESSATAVSGTLVVPMVYPITRSKTVTYELSNGLTYNHYDLLDSSGNGGTLTAKGAQGSVTVINSQPGKLFEDHLSELPEKFCAGTNLWTLLPHDNEFYAPTGGWKVHSSGNVYSVTIPVDAGDKIFATSFGKAESNGNGGSNGIRVTFFGANGVVKTLDPAATYTEFTQNGGYLIAPEGSVAINVPMWSNADSWELYLLNREHSYTKSDTPPTCTEQGYTTYTCACGESYVADEVEAIGHSWDNGSVTTQPTCTETGVKVFTCQHDSTHTRTETVAQTGHTEDVAIRENEITATCTKAGSYDEVVYCTNCQTELSRKTVSIPMLEHTPQVIPAVPPTYDDPGLTEGSRCSACGTILKAQETVPVKEPVLHAELDAATGVLTVSGTLSDAASVSTPVFVAVYSAGGQLLTVKQPVDLVPSQIAVVLDNCFGAASVRIFRLDANYLPSAVSAFAAVTK